MIDFWSGFSSCQWLSCSRFAPSAHSSRENLLTCHFIYHLRIQGGQGDVGPTFIHTDQSLGLHPAHLPAPADSFLLIAYASSKDCFDCVLIDITPPWLSFPPGRPGLAHGISNEQIEMALIAPASSNGRAGGKTHIRMEREPRLPARLRFPPGGPDDSTAIGDEEI
jgi:hypothetical protein